MTLVMLLMTRVVMVMLMAALIVTVKAESMVVVIARTGKTYRTIVVHSPKSLGSRGERGARVHSTKAAQQLVFLHAVGLWHSPASLPLPRVRTPA
ncbi:hypothetical protein E2C01_039945 [Portunus trituberculatus]|uniref:Secreted protein n=1 Tax=Portunus trituberculatus TaxID=210409 RepID=A0A5B7FG33_PORTR|nr:hypothetical protein [Portunus trituberculatus]